MRSVTIADLSSGAFQRFGRVVDLKSGNDPSVVETHGDGWLDRYTRSAIVGQVPSLGRTESSSVDDPVAFMERHQRVEEAIIPSTQAVILTVAPPTEAEQPDAKDVQAFVIQVGTVVIMDPGVWHAECAGVESGIPYFWLARCVDAGSTPWTAIEGGSVRLVASAHFEDGGNY
jgi:ureidoglycolate hydrolase